MKLQGSPHDDTGAGYKKIIQPQRMKSHTAIQYHVYLAVDRWSDEATRLLFTFCDNTATRKYIQPV